MRPDDEHFLTAYLDGELDAADRHRVQAALATSPGLARRLLDLAEARDLVEGLGRPAAPADLADSVLGRIARPASPWAFRVGSARVVSPRWLAVASGLAAACLLVTFAATRPEPLEPRVVADLDLRLPNLPEPVELLPEPPTAPASVAESAPPRSPEAEPPVVASISPVDARAEADRLLQQGRIEALISRRDVRKITVPVDRIETQAVAEIRRSIEETPRKVALSAQVTVTRGILIDPKAPEGAIVFLVVLDDAERELFYSKLHDRFPGVSNESIAPIGEVVQLAEMGRANAIDGPVTPHLSTPPTDPKLAQQGGSDAPLRGFEPPGLTLPDALSVPKSLVRPPSGPAIRRRPRSIGGSTPGLGSEVEPRGTPIVDREDDLPLVLVWLVPRKADRRT